MNHQQDSIEPTIESLPTTLSIFFKSLPNTQARCHKCKKVLKYSSKATSNLITHLRRCSPNLHLQYLNLKNKHHAKKAAKDCFQQDSTPTFLQSASERFASHDAPQKALTKALLKSIACDQLSLNIIDSQTFRNLLLTAEPRFVIPSRSTIRNSLIPAVTAKMEEAMRRELACIPHVYLTIDLWTNRNIESFLGITVHFVDAEWKLRSFVLAADSLLEKHTADSIGKAYDEVIEKFKLTGKVTKVVSHNASSMIKAFQVSLPEFMLHEAGEESNGEDVEQLQPDSGFEQEFLKDCSDINALLAYLPERVSCFAHTKQLCIKDCLQDSEFLKSFIGKQLGKVSNIVNSVRKSTIASSYLQRKNITLRAMNVTRWNSQLVILQSVLKDHEEVNTALTMIQSQDKITNKDLLALSELVDVLLPFKEAMQQVEGENIVTSSCICPVVVGLLKALEQLKNSDLIYCRKLVDRLQDSVSKRLLPFLDSLDNKLASLLDPRFKNKWIEDDVQREEAKNLLLIHVGSRLGKADDVVDGSSTDDEGENPAKKPKIFVFMGAGVKKKRSSCSITEVESYLKEDIMPYDEDPLTYWKKKSYELPTLAALAKDYLGLTATSVLSKRLFSIAGNFYNAKRNLLGTDTFRSLMFIKCNPAMFENVKL